MKQPQQEPEVIDIPKNAIAPGTPMIHQLSPSEKALLQNLNIRVNNSKCAIFDLQVRLEREKAAYDAAQAQIDSALLGIAVGNGMATAQISADFNSIQGVSA